MDTCRLGFRLAFQKFDDPPTQTVRLIPVFPGVRPDIKEKTNIVWDLPQLLESIRRPGGYHVLNCSCGDTGHANILEAMFVAHPDDETVVWEIDIPSHRSALDEGLRATEGVLRITFNRAAYEADIFAMLDAVLSAGTPDLPVDEYDPDRGGEAYERLQALAKKNDWSRQPILPPGSILDFRIHRDDWMLLDGRHLREYAPRLFTRRAALQAFDRWADFFLMGQDLQQCDRPACDEAGREFAAILQQCYQEGATAPGVTVRYCADG
jgi:hypothetical protein